MTASTIVIIIIIINNNAIFFFFIISTLSSVFFRSLQLHGDPRDQSGMDQTSDLAVHRPGLAVDHEQRFVGRRDHVVTEDTRRGYRAVRVTPLRQRLEHGLAHAGDHFHFTCDKINIHILMCFRSKLQKKKTVLPVSTLLSTLVDEPYTTRHRHPLQHHT